MPHFLSPDAQSLLRALFKRNAANRLGSGDQASFVLYINQFRSIITKGNRTTVQTSRDHNRQHIVL
uniref:DUF4372 domain-containing protein n=1 Tax=Angiostrongylus cantonensis TaxID=6313 RepID=A0A0K0CSS4_ANGCA